MRGHRSTPSYGALERREGSSSNDEGERLLLTQGGAAASDWDLEDVQRPEPSSEAQEGVRTIEAVNLTWTRRSLCIAYVRFGKIILPFEGVAACANLS